MNLKYKDEELNRLFDAILALKNREECEQLLDDLCTVSEVLAMKQRLQVAVLLRSGAPYHDIVEKTGASTSTISRVNRCLQYGSEGYNTVLDRIEAK
ncbi:MAG: TrpR-like protein, YerC/YecD [Clostridia bacterium]|nr:TrpR-like protein, YerC/YecD [Clostridia bacterium]